MFSFDEKKGEAFQLQPPVSIPTVPVTAGSNSGLSPGRGPAETRVITDPPPRLTDMNRIAAPHEFRTAPIHGAEASEKPARRSFTAPGGEAETRATHERRAPAESPLMRALMSALGSAAETAPEDHEHGGEVSERLEDFAKALMHALRATERHDRGLHLGWYKQAQHRCECPARRVEELAGATESPAPTPAPTPVPAPVDASASASAEAGSAVTVVSTPGAGEPAAVPTGPVTPPAVDPTPWQRVLDRLTEAFDALQDALAPADEDAAAERPSLAQFLRDLAARLDEADEPADAEATAPGALIELAA